MSSTVSYRILFVCYANACRSQMAEGFARTLAPAGIEVESAGVVAAGVLPETIEAMRKAGVDIRKQHSKPLSQVDLSSFDLIVTLSEVARGHLERKGDGLPLLHRPVLDPVGVRGGKEEVVRMFELTRDDVRGVVEEVLRRVGNERRGASH